MVNAHNSRALNVLGQLGLRATPQRLAVLNLLEGNKSHPSAEEIYLGLKPQFPSLSLATVYSTLEALVQSGELQEINTDPKRRRFDPDVRPHGHFLCNRCGKLWDIDISGVIPQMPEEINGFAVKSYFVNLYGTCPLCIRDERRDAAKQG